MPSQKTKKAYLSYYDLMKRGRKRPSSNTLTQAQWMKASSTERELSKAGIKRKTIHKLKGK